MNEVMNVTTGLASFSGAGMSLGVTAVVFIGAIGVLFLISKNLRRLIYGSVISGLLNITPIDFIYSNIKCTIIIFP